MNQFFAVREFSKFNALLFKIPKKTSKKQLGLKKRPTFLHLWL